jgi:hypothetical protein
MARLSWFFSVVSCVALTCAASRVAAEPEGSQGHPLTWHATPPGSSEPADNVEQSKGPKDDASKAMDEGRLLPFTVGATVPQAHASVTAFGGYDSAARSGRAISAGEARILKFLALRLEYEHGPGTGNSDDRVTFGARVAFLNQAAHGVDLAAGFFFQPKDFRGEGDFVGGLMLGRNFGRWGVFCNTLVGVDSEGDDYSTELRLSSMYRATKQLHVGLDARGRYNFSDDAKRNAAQQLNWEIQAGPLASMALGPVALNAIVGPSALRLTEPSAPARTALGVVGMAGAGAVF